MYQSSLYLSMLTSTASPIGLIPFPVGVSLGNPALAVTRLCHDNMGYVITINNNLQFL